jgi:hypothetical protein
MFRAVEEIYFWSGILENHAEFFLTNLSFRETEFNKSAQYYKNTFTNLHTEAQAMLPTANPASESMLIRRTLPLVFSFIQFKRLALAHLLQCRIELGLPPTFVNHMINEAEEFYRILCEYGTAQKPHPVLENIHLHKIWLPDAAGHAASIASDLDPTETVYIKEAEEFKNSFEHLYIKAVELGLMLERTCLSDGSLDHFNNEVERKINDFIGFLENVRERRARCRILGVLKPLVPDHMIREEKYFIAKIQAVKQNILKTPLQSPAN